MERSNPDVELARELAALTSPVKKACWRNSINALMAYRFRRTESPWEPMYVEGWLIICDGQLPIEHGWLEIEGRIVDVTLPGEYDASCYHPVFRYSMRAVGELVNKRGILPFYPQDHADLRRMYDVYRALPCNAQLFIEQKEQEIAHD